MREFESDKSKLKQLRISKSKLNSWKGEVRSPRFGNYSHQDERQKAETEIRNLVIGRNVTNEDKPLTLNELSTELTSSELQKLQTQDLKSNNKMNKNKKHGNHKETDADAEECESDQILNIQIKNHSNSEVSHNKSGKVSLNSQDLQNASCSKSSKMELLNFKSQERVHKVFYFEFFL